MSLQNHSDKECEFSEVQCVHTGCDERFQRRAQKHHEENCSFKKIACQYCDEMVKVLTAEVKDNYNPLSAIFSDICFKLTVHIQMY